MIARPRTYLSASQPLGTDGDPITSHNDILLRSFTSSN